jgi:hypothetical protein
MQAKRDRTGVAGMTKRKRPSLNQRPQQKLVEPETPPVSEEDRIPVYRRCPCCWGARKGVGVAYSKQGRKRYYKCKRTLVPDAPPCAHTWTAIVTTSVVSIEHQDIDFDTR